MVFMSLLQWAVYHGQQDIASYFLNECQADVNFCQTPIRRATPSPFLSSDTSDSLLASLTVSAVDSPLIIALKKNDLEMAILLINAGARLRPMRDVDANGNGNGGDSTEVKDTETHSGLLMLRSLLAIATNPYGPGGWLDASEAEEIVHTATSITPQPPRELPPPPVKIVIGATLKPPSSLAPVADLLPSLDVMKEETATAVVPANDEDWEDCSEEGDDDDDDEDGDDDGDSDMCGDDDGDDGDDDDDDDDGDGSDGDDGSGSDSGGGSDEDEEPDDRDEICSVSPRAHQSRSTNLPRGGYARAHSGRTPWHDWTDQDPLLDRYDTGIVTDPVHIHPVPSLSPSRTERTEVTTGRSNPSDAPARNFETGYATFVRERGNYLNFMHSRGFGPGAAGGGAGGMSGGGDYAGVRVSENPYPRISSGGISHAATAVTSDARGNQSDSDDEGSNAAHSDEEEDDSEGDSYESSTGGDTDEDSEDSQQGQGLGGGRGPDDVHAYSPRWVQVGPLLGVSPMELRELDDDDYSDDEDEEEEEEEEEEEDEWEWNGNSPESGMVGGVDPSSLSSIASLVSGPGASPVPRQRGVQRVGVLRRFGRVPAWPGPYPRLLCGRPPSFHSYFNPHKDALTREDTERRRLHPDLLLSNRRWGLDVCGMDRRLLPLPYVEAVERVMMEMGEKLGVGTGAEVGGDAPQRTTPPPPPPPVEYVYGLQNQIPYVPPTSTPLPTETTIIGITSPASIQVCPTCGEGYCGCRIVGGKGEWGDNLPTAASFEVHIPLPTVLSEMEMAAHTHTLLSAMYYGITSLPSRFHLLLLLPLPPLPSPSTPILFHRTLFLYMYFLFI